MDINRINPNVLSVFQNNQLVSIVGDVPSRSALLSEVVKSLAPDIGMGIYKTNPLGVVDKNRVFTIQGVMFIDGLIKPSEITIDKQIILVLDGDQWCNYTLEKLQEMYCRPDKPILIVRLLSPSTEIVRDGTVLILGSDVAIPKLNDAYKRQFLSKPKGAGKILIDDRKLCKMMFASLSGNSIPVAAADASHTVVPAAASILRTKVMKSQDLGFMSGPKSFGVTAREDDFGLGWGLKAPIGNEYINSMTPTAYSGKSSLLASSRRPLVTTLPSGFSSTHTPLKQEIPCECGPMCLGEKADRQLDLLILDDCQIGFPFTDVEEELAAELPEPAEPAIPFEELMTRILNHNTIVLLGKNMDTLERGLMHVAKADVYTIFCKQTSDAYSEAWFQSYIYPCYVHYDCEQPYNTNYLLGKGESGVKKCVLTKDWDKILNNPNADCLQIASCKDIVPVCDNKKDNTLVICSKDFPGNYSSIHAMFMKCTHMSLTKEEEEVFKAKQLRLKENEYLAVFSNGQLVTTYLDPTLSIFGSRILPFNLGGSEYCKWGYRLSNPELPPPGIRALLQKPMSVSSGFHDLNYMQ
jgi:hypothetical protein